MKILTIIFCAILLSGCYMSQPKRHACDKTAAEWNNLEHFNALAGHANPRRLYEICRENGLLIVR